MSARPAVAVLGALLELGREERQIIESGRIEQLETIASRRLALVDELERSLAAGAAGGDHFSDVLEMVRRQGEQNLVLLKSIQSDITREIESGRQAGRAIDRYGSSSRI